MFIKSVMVISTVVLSLSVSVVASPFSSVIVYGDSLSDNGNFFAQTGLPAPPYYQGRSSNGPVAVEQLAVFLNASLVDFAWAGATTGIGNHLDGGTATTIVMLPGMRTTFEATKGSLGPYLNDLFVVWGGPNDFLSPASGDTTPALITARAIADLVYIVGQLQGLGVQHILVPGLPDLGLTPAYASQGPLIAAGATTLSIGFNMALKSQLPSGVTYFDTAVLLRTVVSNPAAYGFTNVTAPCLVGSVVCATPQTYLFWDDLHPTAAGHAILAGEFAAAVPEPATAVITFAGLLSFMLLASYRSRARFWDVSGRQNCDHNEGRF